MSGKTKKPTQRAALTLSDIEELRRKGYNQSQIADMYGVSRQAVSWHLKTYGGRLTLRGQVDAAWPFDTTSEHSKSKAYQSLRDHGEYQLALGRGMSDDKLKRLKSWWKKLCDEDVVLEFDPEIKPYPGMAGGGFRYVPRRLEDEDRVIRVNEHTNLTPVGEAIWCWPSDIDTLITR